MCPRLHTIAGSCGVGPAQTWNQIAGPQSGQETLLRLGEFIQDHWALLKAKDSGIPVRCLNASDDLGVQGRAAGSIAQAEGDGIKTEGTAFIVVQVLLEVQGKQVQVFPGG